jgi:hypothetical protein
MDSKGVKLWTRAELDQMYKNFPRLNICESSCYDGIIIPLYVCIDLENAEERESGKIKKSLKIMSQALFQDYESALMRVGARDRWMNIEAGVRARRFQFPLVNRFCMVFLCGCTGRLTAQNHLFWARAVDL